MKIIPNDNLVLVKQIKLEQNKTSSGLVLPSTLDRESKTQGKVLSTGRNLTEFQDKIVAFGTFAGEKLKVQENGKEEEYILLKDEEILACLE